MIRGQQTAPGPPPNATVAGELLIEPPTLINPGFEWFIQGDANRNASVAVSFRKQGLERDRPVPAYGPRPVTR